MKVKTILACLLICIIVLISTQVNAASGTVSLTGASEAKPGDKITVNVNVNATEDGIDGLVADLAYSTDVLTLETSNAYTYMEGIIMVIMDTELKAGELETIPLVFTVNSNTTAKEATINLTDIKLTDTSKTEVDKGNLSKTIKITTDEQKPINNVVNEDKNTNINTNTSNKTTQTQDNTTANTVISKAGLEMITLPGIVIIAIIAIVTYKKYKNVM